MMPPTPVSGSVATTVYTTDPLEALYSKAKNRLKNIHSQRLSNEKHKQIPDIYIVPFQETYSEALSVQLRPKRNVLRSLQKEAYTVLTAPVRGSKHSVRGSSFQVEEPITEKALRCLSAERIRETKSSPRAEPKNEGLGRKLNPKPAYIDQSSTGYRPQDKCYIKQTNYSPQTCIGSM